MQMKILLLTLLCLPLNAMCASLEFKKDGALMKSYSIEQLKSGKLGTLKSEEVDIYNAWRGYRRVYLGYDLFSVLDSLYGRAWRSSYMIKFVATDGYLSHSNIKEMLKLCAGSGKRGLLSYSEKGRDGFTPVKHDDKEVDPGPVYL